MLIPLKLIRGRPLQQQLYDQLRTLIASGRLQAGARMPSTRMLAEQFAISRITVILTYERLVAEGVLYTLPAAGTFVGTVQGSGSPGLAREPASRSVAAGAHEVGLPDPELFPANRWRAALRHALDRAGLRQPGDTQDDSPSLRSTISGWLAATRGLSVAPEQIVVVSGRRRALDMIIELLGPSGRRALIEAPCDAAVTRAYERVGAKIVTVPVDEDGMRTEGLPAGTAALAHVTSGHQNPLGVVLSSERRETLAAWAAAAGAFIVEEDQDADLRTDAALVPPMAAGPAASRVIYMSGFAATMAPWLQLAYLVLPPALAEKAATAHRAIDEHASWLEEAALGEFIVSGAFARHVHRARKVYAGRRHALAEARLVHLPEISLVGADNGLHQAWRLPDGFELVDRFLEVAGSRGLIAARPAPCSVARGMPLDRIVLVDVARINEVRIDQTLGEIARAIRNGDGSAARPEAREIAAD